MYSDDTNIIFHSAKAEIFVSNSTHEILNYPSSSSSITPFNSFMPTIVISSLSGLSIKKGYGPKGIPLLVLKTCASEFAPYFDKVLSLFIYFDLQFFLGICIHSMCENYL